MKKLTKEEMIITEELFDMQSHEGVRIQVFIDAVTEMVSVYKDQFEDYADASEALNAAMFHLNKANKWVSLVDDEENN